MAYVYDKVTTSVVMAAGIVDAQFRGELALQNRFARVLPAALKANTRENNEEIAALVTAEVQHVLQNTRVSVKVSEIKRIDNGEKIDVFYDVTVMDSGRDVLKALNSDVESIDRDYIYDPTKKIFVARNKLTVVTPDFVGAMRKQVQA